MIDLDKLLELEAKAAVRPWGDFASHGCAFKHDGEWIDIGDEEYSLISAMRNNIKELCLELKASRKVVQEARELVRRKGGFITDLAKSLEELDGEK